jgi:hypothetical protein
MGAVFAAFAAFYFWFNVIRSFTTFEHLRWAYVYNPYEIPTTILYRRADFSYNETAGIIHFFTTFLGVNLTFFPMHLLGLSGMPRRIPDFPDAYLHLNQIASYGSFITLVSTLIFFIFAIVLNMNFFINSLPAICYILISTIKLNYLLFNRYFFYRDWEREWRKYLAYERVTASLILKMHIKTLARLKYKKWKRGASGTVLIGTSTVYLTSPNVVDR